MCLSKCYVIRSGGPGENIQRCLGVRFEAADFLNGSVRLSATTYMESVKSEIS